MPSSVGSRHLTNQRGVLRSRDQMARCDWSPLAPALEVPLAAQPPPPLVGAKQGADGGNRIIKVLEDFGIKIFYFVREVMICYLLTADQSQARTGAC